MALEITAGEGSIKKDMHIAMIRHDVSQADIAKYENVSPQAINNRLARMTREKASDFKTLIKRVKVWKRTRLSQKAAG